ncbi:MAG TPA: hydroxymethylglutaryl-CoA lyase [Bacteroidia bacterium]|jgi:hydroxymethylglutaryl-CoA lyase|nr:hydroxymethylglutaryl-CoA lyase [Bacteroidia bacterium]
MPAEVQLIECPRDAMQGIHDFIPTEKKISYINSILKCGFDTVDFGSFVSPKAIPQLRDTAEVLSKLELTKSKLLAIIANVRGAEDAVKFDEISYLGYPFSISETFQLRNTNATIEGSLKRVEEIQQLCMQKNKKLVVYISMAFGNPYGDPWNADIAIQWTKKLSEMGIEIIALADTIGVSNPENINYLFSNIIPEFPKLTIGAHLHTTPDTWKEKVEAAWNSGCRRFDSAIKGFGGCPMATDKLTGNMPTESVLSFLQEKKVESGIDMNNFGKAMAEAGSVFPL